MWSEVRAIGDGVYAMPVFERIIAGTAMGDAGREAGAVSDSDGNGRIDFADGVWLFNHL